MSAAQLVKDEIRAFVARFRLLCSCPLEVRAEAGGIVCAKCGSPLVKARAS